MLPLRIHGLRKRFGDLVAVDGVDLEVRPQEVVCLVGPNGAGKSTTVECALGLQPADAGEVAVLGSDPVAHRTSVFEHVGVQVQDNGLYARVRVGEVLQTYARMYAEPHDVGSLISLFGLEHRARAFFRELSGGERRKLLTAIALVGNPTFAVLDEPGSGLDPHARAALWRALDTLRTRGLAVLLTTHDMQEAQDHADRVYIMHRGRVVAHGAPADLLREHDLETRVSVRPHPGVQVASAPLSAIPGVTHVEVGERDAVVFGSGAGFTSAAVTAVEDDGAVTVRPANLEDLYLLLTDDAYEAPRTSDLHSPAAV